MLRYPFQVSSNRSGPNLKQQHLQADRSYSEHSEHKGRSENVEDESGKCCTPTLPCEVVLEGERG